jgi:hypothetical protein
MLSYSVSYSAPATSRSSNDHIASDLVGVAGFEPAASSSRTKRAAKLRYTPSPAPNIGAGRTPDSLAETRTRSGPAEHRNRPGAGSLAGVSRNRVAPG